MNKNITISLIQQSNSVDAKDNIARTLLKTSEAAENGADIICLQELFNTIYFCFEENYSYFDWAETLQSDFIKSFQKIAKNSETVIIVPFFEKRQKGLYHNSALIIDADGEIQEVYRKIHIPDDPGFSEKFYFTPGDDGYKVYKTRYGTIGLLICWDQWFPEAARITALMGADIIFYPTAIGILDSETDEEKKKFHSAWQTIQLSHAIANGCYVAAVNRVGKENNLTFWGGSFICDTFGEVIAEADDKEGVLNASIDLSEIEKQRQIWPFLRDRRIDTYHLITKRIID